MYTQGDHAMYIHFDHGVLRGWVRNENDDSVVAAQIFSLASLDLWIYPCATFSCEVIN